MKCGVGVEYLREKFREGKFAAPKDKTEALGRDASKLIIILRRPKLQEAEINENKVL